MRGGYAGKGKRVDGTSARLTACVLGRASIRHQSDSNRLQVPTLFTTNRHHQATTRKHGFYNGSAGSPTAKRADKCRRAQMLRRKTRLMEGEARDEGASAELSDMRRRGSSDARLDTSQGEKPVSRRRSIAARIAAKTTGAAAQGA